MCSKSAQECQYKHEIMPEDFWPSTPPRRDNYPVSSAKTQPANPVYLNPSFNLTQVQLDSVGPVSGRYASGYSQNQLKKLKTLEEVLHPATTLTEHRVQVFSSWGNPSQPAYTTHGEKANTLMRTRIDPNNQRILKTQRLDNSWKTSPYIRSHIRKYHISCCQFRYLKYDVE